MYAAHVRICGNARTCGLIRVCGLDRIEPVLRQEFAFMLDERYDGYYGNKTRALLLLAAALVGGALMQSGARYEFLMDTGLGLLLPTAAAVLFSLLFFAMSPVWAPLLAVALFGFGYLLSRDILQSLFSVLSFLPAALVTVFSIKKKMSLKDSTLLCVAALILMLAASVAADAWRLFDTLDSASVLGVAERWFDLAVEPMRAAAQGDAGLRATMNAYLQQLQAVFLANWPSIFVSLLLVRAFLSVLLGRFLFRRLNGIRMDWEQLGMFSVSKPGAAFYSASFVLGSLLQGTLMGRVFSNLFLILLPALVLHGGAVFWYLRRYGSPRLRGLLLTVLILLCLLMTPVGGMMLLSVLGVVDSFGELRKRIKRYQSM